MTFPLRETNRKTRRYIQFFFGKKNFKEDFDWQNAEGTSGEVLRESG